MHTPSHRHKQWEFAFDKLGRLQSTAYRTRNPSADTFLEVISKKKTFVHYCTFFSKITSLQSSIVDFNKIRLQEK